MKTGREGMEVREFKTREEAIAAGYRMLNRKQRRAEASKSRKQKRKVERK